MRSRMRGFDLNLRVGELEGLGTKLIFFKPTLKGRNQSVNSVKIKSLLTSKFKFIFFDPNLKGRKINFTYDKSHLFGMAFVILSYYF